VGDAGTGAIRTLSTRAVERAGVDVYGRGGNESDGDRFLVLEDSGSVIQLQAVTVDARRTLMRSFPKRDSVWAIAVAGDKLAWATRSRDSVTLFVATGAGATPRRLLSLGRPRGTAYYDLAWSYDGKSLAIHKAQDDKVSIDVASFDPDGALRRPLTHLSANASGDWGIRWARDDKAVFVIATPEGWRNEGIVRIPLNPSEAPTVVTPQDVAIGDYFHVSPDGKSIVFPSARTLGTTIWRVDFVPPAR
jgi:hypothetical protein